MIENQQQMTLNTKNMKRPRNFQNATNSSPPAQLVMEGLELWQKNSEFFVQKSVIS